MPIDVETVNSPGWWMKRLFGRLNYQLRQRRLQLLYDYRVGNCPLPQGAENAQEAFRAFQQKARSNFADLIVSAVSERMTPVGFRTALDEDETGDAEVGDLWQQTGLDVESSDVHNLMLSLSESYVIVGEVDEDTGAPTVTAEDPRFMVAECDPAQPRKIRAALKVLHDDAEKQDRAYLYLPGSGTDSKLAEVWVAVRQSKYNDWGVTPLTGVASRVGLLSFNANAWDWDQERSGRLKHPRIPVVRFANKDCLGEYEAHLDLVDRINHQVLQRMVIATMQAFRQRAIIGLPTIDPTTNEEIDYSDVFTSDPAALWQLPPEASMWESSQVDLRPILSAVQDDIQALAAVTRTPLHMLMPAGENQSAEGATLQREGLTFKVRDRIARTSHAWAQVMSLILLQLGQTDRADISKLRTIWLPPEHLSLAERADAASKAAADIPRRSRLIKIWGFSPDEADRMMSEFADDQLQQQLAVAPATAAPTVAPPAANAPATVTGDQQQNANQQQQPPPNGNQQPAAPAAKGTATAP